MSAVSGIVFGAALAVYILSHYDRRVKKVYALVVALIAALTALADFTSSPIAVGQECRTDAATGTQTCVTKYTNDPTALIAFAMSIILMIMALIEMSLEGAASSAWP
jgi:multisubunit Na+/H+ antiporter MnhB subunit